MHNNSRTCSPFQWYEQQGNFRSAVNILYHLGQHHHRIPKEVVARANVNLLALLPEPKDITGRTKQNHTKRASVKQGKANIQCQALLHKPTTKQGIQKNIYTNTQKRSMDVLTEDHQALIFHPNGPKASSLWSRSVPFNYSLFYRYRAALIYANVWVALARWAAALCGIKRSTGDVRRKVCRHTKNTATFDNFAISDELNLMNVCPKFSFANAAVKYMEQKHVWHMRHCHVHTNI